MDFNREWTQFALDAEVDHYGTARIAKAHNALRSQIASLRAGLANLRAGLAEAKNTNLVDYIDALLGDA
jgi:hypothetical protein